MAMPKDDVWTPMFDVSTFGREATYSMTALRSSWWTKPLQSSAPWLRRLPGWPVPRPSGLNAATTNP